MRSSRALAKLGRAAFKKNAPAPARRRAKAPKPQK
jgi:hypothetical protein